MPPGSEPKPAPPPAGALGVYVHLPFCSVRCSYCDFPTVAGRDDRIGSYLLALGREIAQHQDGAAGRVDTVFFGGGTPSRLSPGQLERIVRALGERFEIDADAEITLEGNPESLTVEHLQGYRRVGVTRISVGVQSLDDGVLARAGRAHDAREAERAVADARRAGFPDVSLDLIEGLPGEDLARWGETLRRAAALGPDHISVYLLETDKDTPLGRAVRGGRQPLADDDAMASVYEVTVDALEECGLEQYEISNFARGDRRSRHNMKYWTDAPYAGFGLGASGYWGGGRRSNRRDLDGYVADLQAGIDPVAERDPYDPARRLEEALFLGLRVVEGVDLLTLGTRYDADPARRFSAAWERAQAAGLIVREGTRVRLTREGRVRSNELFAELLGGEG